MHSHCSRSDAWLFFHVPCEYFQNNGVTWCINNVYFEDVCLKPFSFLFIENTDIE